MSIIYHLFSQYGNKHYSAIGFKKKKTIFSVFPYPKCGDFGWYISFLISQILNTYHVMQFVVLYRDFIEKSFKKIMRVFIPLIFIWCLIFNFYRKMNLQFCWWFRLWNSSAFHFHDVYAIDICIIFVHKILITIEILNIYFRNALSMI